MADAPKFHAVAPEGAIPEGQGRPFEVDGRMIAVFLSNGRYFALDDSCPHQGMPLSDGEVCDGSVTCTWHGWRFALDDGRWLDSPRVKVPAHPVRVVAGQIEVGLSD